MKAVVLAAFNQQKALVGAFSVITNLRMDLFEALMVMVRVMLVVRRQRRRLWVLGGSTSPQRYRVEVLARDLDSPTAAWVRMPDLLDARMWQAGTSHHRTVNGASRCFHSARRMLCQTHLMSFSRSSVDNSIS